MFRLGDYNAICDKCGMRRYASECHLDWQGLFLCKECYEPRHPQDFVENIPEDQSVPIPRLDIPQTMGETTVLTAALINALTIDITSISGLADGDSIGIVLDNGAAHWSFCNGTPSGNTVTLGSYLPFSAAAGNVVYKPSINSASFITTTTLTATGL